MRYPLPQKCDQADKVMTVFGTLGHSQTHNNILKFGKNKQKICMDNDKLKLIRHYGKVYDCMASPLGTHLPSVNSLFALNIKCIKNVCIYSLSKFIEM